MRPTIYTVAEEAGVSIATVSRVLNGNARVSEETRARVRRTMDTLNYQPNASARGLAANTTGTLALVFPALSGPFFSTLIQGAETEAGDSGYYLLIYGTSGDTLETENQTLGLLAGKVDGMILTTGSVSHCYLQALQEKVVPIVMLGGVPSGMTVDSIGPDNVGGAAKIVAHLIGHGYRRIAMIKGSETQSHASDREIGYQKALCDHGLSFYPELVIAGAFDERSGYAAMLQLLQRNPIPEAVFAANDQMAFGAMAAIHENGLCVPGDIALAGFDNIEMARYVQPPLTTVHQDIHGQGQLAVRMLIARVNEADAVVENKEIPTELVIRQSCGCSHS